MHNHLACQYNVPIREWEIIKGRLFKKEIQFNIDGVLLDFTGSILEMKIKAYNPELNTIGSELVTLSTGNGKITIENQTKLIFRVLGSETININSSWAIADLKHTDSLGVVQPRYFIAVIKINEPIT